MISLIVLLIVFILIAVRHIGRVTLRIWQIMLSGAIAVLLTGQISLINALKAVNLDVILFLLGMFVVGEALERSGYLSYLVSKFFKKAKSTDHLVLYLLFGMGIASAFLMNDTLAIIGTPLVLLFAQRHNMSSKLLLLTLAFAVTIGSAMSPIGNPQNLLIAINGNLKNPFFTFFQFLFIPTIINLFLTYLLLKFFYKEEFHDNLLNRSEEVIKDKKLTALSKISLILIIILIAAKISIVFLNIPVDFKLTYIALIAMLPILLFGPERLNILKNIDWHTLIFFAAMFVLMQSVWDGGFFQTIIKNLNINIASILMIFIVSIILSQFISNVPLVALYLPLLLHFKVPAKAFLALAAGSTIAGNLLILGAASNVIIIQNAEKKARETLTFLEFARVGIPLTIINIAIYWMFLTLI